MSKLIEFKIAQGRISLDSERITAILSRAYTTIIYIDSTPFEVSELYDDVIASIKKS